MDYLARSRILKAMTDQENSLGFDEAELRLSKVFVTIVVSDEQSCTAAGQAAALTAVVTAMKCFRQVTIVCRPEIDLIRPLPLGRTLGSAATALGANIERKIPPASTHVISIGDSVTDAGIFIRCWWDGWLSGVLPDWEQRPLGVSANPLAGVFSGAMAIREIFANVLGRRAGNRVSVCSLWEPWKTLNENPANPAEVYMPLDLWFIGLGHLGQGFLWNLGFLGVRGRAILQDSQSVGPENQATGLLTTEQHTGSRKTRVANRWVEDLGWTTDLLERKHYGDIRVCDDDPSIVICGLDNPDARKAIARSGFDYMVDAGVGHGPTDFEIMQLSILSKNSDPDRFWTRQPVKDVQKILEKAAYREQAEKEKARTKNVCGTFMMAEASVAVPFVGAGVGAISIAQAIRLASMQETPQMLQMDLSAPEMVLPPVLNGQPAIIIKSHKLIVGKNYDRTE